MCVTPNYLRTYVWSGKGALYLQKKIEKKSLRRLFFHDSRYFSVFLNIASMSVSVVPIIAMSVSVSMSINQPTSKWHHLTNCIAIYKLTLWRRAYIIYHDIIK